MYKILPILLFAYGLAITTDDIYDNSSTLIVNKDKIKLFNLLNNQIFIYDDKILDDCSLIADKMCKPLKNFMNKSKNFFIRMIIKILLVLRGCNIDDEPDDE